MIQSLLLDCQIQGNTLVSFHLICIYSSPTIVYCTKVIARIDIKLQALSGFNQVVVVTHIMNPKKSHIHKIWILNIIETLKLLR